MRAPYRHISALAVNPLLNSRLPSVRSWPAAMPGTWLLVGLIQVDRLVDRAAVQQQRARQPGRLQVQHADDPGTGQLDRPYWSSPGLTSAGARIIGVLDLE